MDRNSTGSKGSNTNTSGSHNCHSPHSHESFTRDKPPHMDELTKVALTAFFNIARLWQLKPEEELILLGKPARSTFFKWKKEKQGHLSQDTLERISYIMGIYKALHILLPTNSAADNWPKKANQAPLFNGKTALDKMLAGNVVDLADVRRYLDAERG